MVSLHYRNTVLHINYDQSKLSELKNDFETLKNIT